MVHGSTPQANLEHQVGLIATPGARPLGRPVIGVVVGRRAEVEHRSVRPLPVLVQAFGERALCGRQLQVDDDGGRVRVRRLRGEREGERRGEQTQVVDAERRVAGGADRWRTRWLVDFEAGRLAKPQ